MAHSVLLSYASAKLRRGEQQPPTMNVSDRNRVYSSYVGRRTDQERSTELQLKEFKQAEPMLVVAKWFGPGGIY